MAGSLHTKAEVPTGNEKRGPVFTDEWLGDADFLLDELNLRPGLARTEDERNMCVLNTTQRAVRRRVTRKGMGLEQCVVEVAKHHNRRGWLHVGTHGSGPERTPNERPARIRSGRYSRG